jgi:large subunit ribosomal protein L17
MKKKVFGRKLSRSRPTREALFVSLVKAMIVNGKIVTTRAKAKAIIGDLEHYVTLAKKADISSRRRILSDLDNSGKEVDLLIQKVAPSFTTRTSGYTRLISLPTRKGDNAQMVRIEWTDKIDYGQKSIVYTKTSKKEKVSKPKEVKTKNVTKPTTKVQKPKTK